MSSEFNDFCIREGIKKVMTLAYTPQQHGVAKRKKRILVDAILAMLTHAKLPKIFWREPLLTTNYLQNRSLTKAISSHQTRFEIQFGRQSNLSYSKKLGAKPMYQFKQNLEQSKIHIQFKLFFWNIVKSLGLIGL